MISPHPSALISPARRGGGGFSLIEVLCATAVGALVLLAAASMLDRSGAGYERIGGGVVSEREARALVARLTADLASARFHRGVLAEKSSAAWPTDRLGWLCLLPAAAQSEGGRIGDLCAVHYYVADLTIDGKTVRCLMRGCRESNDTFLALGNDNVRSLFTPHHPGDEPVAFGVVSFEARPKAPDAAGAWLDWPPNSQTGPEALDLTLVVARRGLAANLRSPADWNGAGGKLLGEPAAARRHAQLEVYATRIPFGNPDENRPLSPE